MNLKKIILALTGLGVLAMLLTTVNFYIEKNKHNHPMAMRSMPQADSAEEKTAFNPAPDQSVAPTSAPKIDNAMLPETIPPAMLKAMQEQGISLEDLQQNMGQNAQTEKSGIEKSGIEKSGNAPKTDDPKIGADGVPESLKSDVVFPEAMLKAMEEQRKKQNAPEMDKDGSENPELSEQAIFDKAVNHIRSHGKEAETEHLMQGLAAIQKNQGNATTYIHVADTLVEHGEIKAAEIILQKGIAQNPDNAILPYLYGQALSKDLRFEKAAEQWEKALDLEQSAEVHYSLAMLYRYKLNNEEKAKEHFTRSKALPAHDPSLAEHLKAELEK